MPLRFNRLVSRLPPWALGLVLTSGLAGLLIAGNFHVLFVPEVHEVGDAALNAIQIHHAKSGGELYGNYSRFRFNHPGPAFFYVYAVAELILHDAWQVVPSPHQAHLIGGILLQVGSFVVALFLLAGLLGSRRVIVGGLVVGSVYFTPQARVFWSIWPPEVLLMPFLVFFLACAAVAAGQFRRLPWAAASGSFLVHGHVAQPLFVVPLFVGAIVMGALACRRDGCSWQTLRRETTGPALVAFAFLGVFSAPILYDVLRGAESNLAAILRHLQTHPSEGRTIGDASVYFLRFVSNTYDGEQVVDVAPLGLLRAHPVALILWSLSLGALLAVYWQSRRSRATAARGIRAYCHLWLGTLALCLVWGVMQTGPLFAFNAHFFFALHYLVFLGAVSAWIPQIPAALGRGVMAAGLISSAVILGYRFHGELRTEHPLALSLRDGVRAALQTHGRSPATVLSFDHDNWPEAAAIALALQRSSAEFRVGAGYAHLFQRRHTLDLHRGAEADFSSRVWRLVSRPQGDALPMAPHLHLEFEAPVLAADGGEIRFDLADEVTRFALSGISSAVPEVGAWTEAPQAALLFTPAPTDRGVELHLIAEPFLIPGVMDVQQARLYFNEHLVFSAPFTGPGVLRAFIPAAVWNERPTALLRLELPDARSPADLRVSTDPRPLALLLKRLTTQTRAE